MICLIALVVFGILGIFSASHRKIALKAFDCVFRRMTLRPCNSGLNQQLKTGIVSFFSKKNVKLARFIVKNFELLSWFFTILMVASIFFSARGIYFYIVYGNCNGDQGGFCVFDALNPGQEIATCTDPSLHLNQTTIMLPGADDDPSIGPTSAKVTIIEFGCYSCPYTKKAEPVVKEILKNYEGKIRFVYRDFHIPSHPGSEVRAAASECADEQSKFWEYHDMLFDRQEQMLDVEELINMADEVNLDAGAFRKCIENETFSEEVNNDFEDGKKAGVYGTPTFFINNVTVVGPKPFAYFKNIIDKELKK